MNGFLRLLRRAPERFPQPATVANTLAGNSAGGGKMIFVNDEGETVFMSDKQKTSAKVICGIFGTIILLLAGFGIGGGSVRKTHGANLPAFDVLNYLSADDAAMLLEEMGNAAMLAQMANDAEKRGEALKQIKELLLIASEADALGLAGDSDVRDNLEITEMQVLAFAYEKKAKADGLHADQSFSPLDNLNLSIAEHDLMNFWQNPENEIKFERLLKSAERQHSIAGAITAEQREAIREQYAKLAISAERARIAGLPYERRIWLQLEIRKAQVLAQAFAQKYEKNFEPTAEEIAAFVAEHPELDARRIRERAETILQRARGGEDFATLANEFSADPGSNEKGGLYENVKKETFVPEFEAAALRLEPGEISDIVESKYGFHIIKLIGKTRENYTVRHILIDAVSGEKPSDNFNRVGFAERAKQAAQKLKTERFFAELEQRYPISLPHPDELKINLPPQPTATPGDVTEPCEDCEGGEPDVEVSTERNEKPELLPTPTDKKDN